MLPSIVDGGSSRYRHAVRSSLSAPPNVNPTVDEFRSNPVKQAGVELPTLHNLVAGFPEAVSQDQGAVHTWQACRRSTGARSVCSCVNT